MLEIKNILFPTDFSDTSAAAQRYAQAFAETLHAALHVLHVVEEPAVATGWTEVYIAALPDVRELERDATRRLGELFSEAERSRLAVHVTTRTGTPFIEIVRYARDHRVDLIVMGTHGRGPIAHMLMGSVAERVLRKAPCPVLAVRQTEHEFVMP